MSSEDYNKMFRLNEKIILELNSQEIYEGYYVDGGKDRIVLNNVHHHNNNNTLEGFLEFYRPEIMNIHTLKISKPKLNGIANPEEKQPVETPRYLTRVIKICEEEYLRLKEMTKSYIYIENADNRYFEAVKVLNDAETVGVVCLGMEKTRFAKCIKLLALSTWKQVYIFNLTNMLENKMYPEIKEILESEYICKVIHKSSGLSDMLFRQYQIYLENVFDTQIIDLILQKKETGNCPETEKNISECLVHYLNFPSSLLENAINVPDKKWNERPLTDQMKLYASQLVTYLNTLKQHFEKMLLKDTYESIIKIQDHVFNLADVEYHKYLKNNNVSKEIQKMI